MIFHMQEIHFHLLTVFTAAVFTQVSTLKFSWVSIKSQRETKRQRAKKQKDRFILNCEWPWSYQYHSMFYTLSTDGAKGQMERLQRLHWEVTLTHTHQNKLKYTSHVHTAVCWSPGERGNNKCSHTTFRAFWKAWVFFFAPERRCSFQLDAAEC